MPIRGIRGATTVTADKADLILQATRELLEEILEDVLPEEENLSLNENTDYTELTM